VSTSELPRINAPVRTLGESPFSRAMHHIGNGSPTWTAEAPSKLVKYFQAGDEQRAWRAWKKRLARRQSPWAGTALATFAVAELLQWGCSRELLDAAARTAISSLFDRDGTPAEERQRSLDLVLNDRGNALDEQTALLHLACAFALPALSAKISQFQWWDLLGRLIGTARDAAILQLPSAPLAHQWLAGELSVALAVLFPELSTCAELMSEGRQALSAGLAELLDGEGTPHARYLIVQQPLLACWTRVRLLTAASDEPCWDSDAEAQYPYAVREMLRLADCGGNSLFVDNSIRKVPKIADLFAAAVILSDDKENRAALHSLRWNGLKRAKTILKKRLPSAANHSEWAQVAVLRPAWKRSSPQLGIAYSDRVFRGEFAIAGERLFTGDWPLGVVVNGRDSAPVEDWDAICWVSDDDVDYLELEIGLDEGRKLQRQVCLAKKDRFLFVADAVLGVRERPLRHLLRVPLGPNVEIVSADESREIRLRASEAKALVFPLSLPEWRVDRRFGELVADPRYLELRQETISANLYAPLWIDLDPKRGRRPFTWRQLTVAEERQIVPRDDAVGYRIQFGNKQWLIYRSLTPPRNRTFLGHNLASEFLIARFGREGSVKALIEVE
jgi:hypothetical protein